MKPYALLFPLMAALAAPAQAEWSSTATLASDYLFNGVSQTGHRAALQVSLDWAGENGFYAGTWASNVDFDDDTRVEIDLYGGYATEFGPGISLDAGIALYSYHGASYSSDSNYHEYYLKFGYAGFDLKAWYTQDYAGLDVDHLTLMVGKTLEINDQWSVSAWVDRSKSLDADRFTWEEDDDSYVHWQLMANTSQAGFDISFGVSGTTLESDAGDTRLLLTLARTFEL
ncbi:MAG: hypothetical protein JXM75_01670 [Chromatiaceae bacterium]|nr:hypothetical protein [Chromatiaceae bacterium]